METRRKIKWSITGGSGFLAAMAFMIGLPGFADDLAAWRRFINEQRVGDLGWKVWFGLALIFVCFALAPWVLPSALSRTGARRAGRRPLGATVPERKTEPEESEADLPTDEERRLIQDIRTVWNRDGQHAVGALSSLLAEVVYSLKEKKYWGALIEPKVRDLDAAREALSKRVHLKSTSSLKEVREQFKETYGAYIGGIYWLAKIEHAGDVVVSNNELHLNRLEEWKVQHCLFADELERLTHVPEHHGTLAIYPSPHMQFDQAFGPLWGELVRRREQAFRKNSTFSKDQGRQPAITVEPLADGSAKYNRRSVRLSVKNSGGVGGTFKAFVRRPDGAPVILKAASIDHGIAGRLTEPLVWQDTGTENPFLAPGAVDAITLFLYKKDGGKYTYWFSQDNITPLPSYHLNTLKGAI